MSADVPVAAWKNGELEVLNEALLPLFLRRVTNVDKWLETRAIDSHRANSRLLKRALRLAEKDDISTVIHVNGATITDNYWIRPIDSELKYSDVRFTDDYFASLALTGSYDSFSKAANSKNTRTPELTNIGSYEKCWRLENGKWYMYKKANPDELFSELLAYRLGIKLGMNMAVYEIGEGFIKTADFTDNASVNFEPASAFMGDNEDYIDVIEVLTRLCPNSIPDYFRLIFLDTIIANPDRHTNNFGLLRNNITGELLGLAPNFDNNMALISRGYPSMPVSGDILIRLFKEVTDRYKELKAFLPELSESIVSECIDEIPINVRGEYITELIMARYELLLSEIKN